MSENRTLFSSGLMSENSPHRRLGIRWALWVVWRGKFIILGCLVLAVTPAMALLQHQPRRYTAEAKVLVQAPEVSDILDDRPTVVFGDFLSASDMATEGALIASPAVAQRVAEKLHLDQDPEFNGAPPSSKGAGSNPSQPPSAPASDAIADALLAGLKVGVEKNTYVISVEYTANAPEKAALIANAFAEVFVAYRLDTSFAEARRLNAWLTERLATLRNEGLAGQNPPARTPGISPEFHDSLAHLGHANVRVLSQARIPPAPSNPGTRKTLATVAELSLLFGLALVFVLDQMNSALRSADEVEDLTGLPMLAMIPYHRRREEDRNEVILGQPRSPLADGFRSLGMALNAMAPSRVILIASSEPREGRSFTALGLAQSFSGAGGRVLLIDGDLDRPSLHIPLNRDGDRGLGQVLAGELRFDEAVFRGVGGAMDFLPAGRHPNLLRTEALKPLLAELSTRYDRIIIDSPPILAVADVLVWAGLADRVIYLVRWNKTTRDSLRHGLSTLRAAGAEIHGVVLSMVDQRKHRRYGYGDYCEYYGRRRPTR